MDLPVFVLCDTNIPNERFYVILYPHLADLRFANRVNLVTVKMSLRTHSKILLNVYIYLKGFEICFFKKFFLFLHLWDIPDNEMCFV
jgi:hypothetical protein